MTTPTRSLWTLWESATQNSRAQSWNPKIYGGAVAPKTIWTSFKNNEYNKKTLGRFQRDVILFINITALHHVITFKPLYKVIIGPRGIWEMYSNWERNSRRTTTEARVELQIDFLSNNGVRCNSNNRLNNLPTWAPSVSATRCIEPANMITLRDLCIWERGGGGGGRHKEWHLPKRTLNKNSDS